MCGRLSQALPAELLTRLFGAADVRREVPPPCWNVAPMQGVTVVARDVPRARRVMIDMEWGLLAPWEGHWETARMRPINARCETIEASGMFKAAFCKRRCLVAVDGWYEWKREAGGKTPHALARSDGRPTVLGGIWECWRSPIGDRLFTLAIVTTPATEELAAIHARMPLVLEPDAWPLWLGEAEGEASTLLHPAEPGRITAWRVGRAVGSPRNDGPHLLAAA